MNCSLIADEFDKNETNEKKHQYVFGFFGEAAINKVIKVPKQIAFDYMHLVQGHSKFIFN